MAKIIYGGDTETVNGKPNSLQFYSEDIACNDIIFCDEKTALKKFLAWCDKRPMKTQNVVYIHNLEFDLVELFYGIHDKLASGEFDFTVGGWHVTGCYGAPTFAKLTSKNRSVLLIDSFSFYRGSLASAADLFCPDLPKLKRPKNLGAIRYTAKDENFCAYAMRDAEIGYFIGKQIERLHTEFDLQQCVSVADLAARIFRHAFLTYTIPQPGRDVIECALQSYHGGKNNIAAPRGWYPNVTALDISSAYPAAMEIMPAFSDDKLYKRITIKNPRSVPPYGVYYVSGTVAECKWPVFFSHSFKPLSGAVDRVAIHGHEINEALRSGEAKISSVRGWYYDAEKDHQAPALRGFVRDFYRRKETEKDKVMRFMYKLILNSISGKFIQTRKTARVQYTDLDLGVSFSASELIAGGMFHPFIASSITAHTRARIHKLEHQYKALHTATDGIFTQSKRLPNETKKLGALAVEGQGDLLMLRNKLYVLYGKGGAIESRAFKGKRIIKYALHGFQGRIHDLEALIATGRRKYTVEKPNRLKQSVKLGRQVNLFESREMILKIGDLPLRK